MDTATLLRYIGQEVRAARKSVGITQRQLAVLANVSERLVRSVEYGEAQNVSISKLASILGPLGLGLYVDNGTIAQGAPVTQDPSYGNLLRQAVAAWNGEG